MFYWQKFVDIDLNYLNFYMLKEITDIINFVA